MQCAVRVSAHKCAISFRLYVKAQNQTMEAPVEVDDIRDSPVNTVLIILASYITSKVCLSP